MKSQRSHTHTHTHTHTLVVGLIVYRYFRKVTGTEGLMMKAIVFPGGKHQVSSKFEALGVLEVSETVCV